jgi:hypothetical protein
LEKSMRTVRLAWEGKGKKEGRNGREGEKSLERRRRRKVRELRKQQQGSRVASVCRI